MVQCLDGDVNNENSHVANMNDGDFDAGQLDIEAPRLSDTRDMTFQQSGTDLNNGDDAQMELDTVEGDPAERVMNLHVGDYNLVMQHNEVIEVEMDDLGIAREEEVNYADNDDNNANNDEHMEENGGVRKKERNPQTWLCNIRKAKRNSGEAYKTKSGKDIQKQKYEYVECNCRWKCGENIQDETRSDIHEQFWALKDWNNPELSKEKQTTLMNLTSRHQECHTSKASVCANQFFSQH